MEKVPFSEFPSTAYKEVVDKILHEDLRPDSTSIPYQKTKRKKKPKKIGYCIFDLEVMISVFFFKSAGSSNRQVVRTANTSW